MQSLCLTHGKRTGNGRGDIEPPAAAVSCELAGREGKMTREPFRLGAWRVDPGLCEIANDEQTLHVEPRAMAVLCHLASRAGTTVSRDELSDEIWKTRHVVEDVLTRCISQLRQSLGDDAKEARYIQTIPKVGYRLLIAPQPLTPPADPPPQAIQCRDGGGGRGWPAQLRRLLPSSPASTVCLRPPRHHEHRHALCRDPAVRGRRRRR